MKNSVICMPLKLSDCLPLCTELFFLELGVNGVSLWWDP